MKSPRFPRKDMFLKGTSRCETVRLRPLAALLSANIIFRRTSRRSATAAAPPWRPKTAARRAIAQSLAKDAPGHSLARGLLLYNYAILISRFDLSSFVFPSRPKSRVELFSNTMSGRGANTPPRTLVRSRPALSPPQRCRPQLFLWRICLVF